MAQQSTLDLLNAAYAWINDAECVPYLVVESQFAGVFVPEHLRQDTPLILNVSLNAVKDLQLSAESVSFTARFAGEVFDVFIPEAAIYSLIARETGCGVTLRTQIDGVDASQPDATSSSGHLKLT